MRHIILYHLSRKYVACRYIIVTLGREISPYDPERPDTLRNHRFVAYSGGLWEVHHDTMHVYFSLLRASRKEAFVETLAPPVALTNYFISLTTPRPNKHPIFYRVLLNLLRNGTWAFVFNRRVSLSTYQINLPLALSKRCTFVIYLQQLRGGMQRLNTRLNNRY